MGFLNTIITRIDKAKEQAASDAEKRDIALKELRINNIPKIKRFVEHYETNVKWLDTDAYIYVIENGKERGVYIPYGTSESQIDIRLDKLVNNIESASKHKSSAKFAKGIDRMLQAADELEGKDTRGRGGFWNNVPTLDELNTNKKGRY